MVTFEIQKKKVESNLKIVSQLLQLQILYQY